MIYNGEHSVTFINDEGEQKNTWTDWLLVPTSRPVIGSPPVKKMGVDIPGRNGTLDITGKITSNVCYENRQGTLEFLIDHENPDYTSWVVTKNKIMSFLHGKHMKLILEDEPAYYYDGRMEVEEFKANSDWSTISIAYDVLPIKYSTASSLDAWKWDPFSFVNGVIRNGEDYQMTVSPNHTGLYTITDINTPSRVKITIEPTESGGGSEGNVYAPPNYPSEYIRYNTAWIPSIYESDLGISLSDTISGHSGIMLNPMRRKINSALSSIIGDLPVPDGDLYFAYRKEYSNLSAYDKVLLIFTADIGFERLKEPTYQDLNNYGIIGIELGYPTRLCAFLHTTEYMTPKVWFLFSNTVLTDFNYTQVYGNYKDGQPTDTYTHRSSNKVNLTLSGGYQDYRVTGYVSSFDVPPSNYSIGFVMTPRNKTLQKRTINMDTIYQPVPNTVTYDLIPGEDFVINWQYNKRSDNDPDLKVRFEFEEGAL